MNKLLIVIDMQNDFITGSLANPAAQAIVKPMVKFIEEWDDDICYTQDTHHENYLETPEGKKLPIPHCVRGTEGWKIQEDIMEAMLAKPFDQRVGGICKETFGHNKWATSNVSGYEEIVLVGTCTDICVLSNAILLKTAFPEKSIVVMGWLCAGLTPEKHKAALEVMKSCQIGVIGE